MQVYKVSITEVETMERLICKYTENGWEFRTPKQMRHYTIHQRS